MSIIYLILLPNNVSQAKNRENKIFSSPAVDVDNQRIYRAVFATDIVGMVDRRCLCSGGKVPPKMKGLKMKNREIKYCRNCVWSESGWCEIYQQPLKPCAGKCLAFLTRHVKKRKTK